MSVKSEHNSEYNRWFITFTCLGWKPLFEITHGYDTVYKWFNYLNENKIADTESYVIMPNHFHAILCMDGGGKNLNKIIANGKRFIAYEIIKRLKQKGETKILNELQEAVYEHEKKKGQKHKVFEPSFDGKPIYSDKFLFQKMDYIHRNPISKKWNLADDFTKYEHSSAAFYELGVAKHFAPKHYMEYGDGI